MRTKTTFTKGNVPKSPGRPRLTDEEKWKARIRRAAEYDFKKACAALLPVATDQLAAELDKKKFKGRDLVNATEMLRDSVHGRPPQAITGQGGGPLLVSFSQVLATVDGAKREKI